MSQKVLVAGTGISGISAAKLLLAQGGEVVLYDGNEKLDAETIKENILHDEEHGVTLTGDVKVILGELSKEVMDRADYALSFSKMTFPHQLMRVILLEQIYRSYRIIHKEPYHK